MPVDRRILATVLVAGMLAAAILAPARAACRNNPPPPVPQPQVVIERVDQSRYPEVDVYFRLIDTNPRTPYAEPQPGSVRLQEGPAGGALQDAEILSNNFDRPILRPLAMMLCLDRSDSVRPVINEINNAVKSYLDLMVQTGNTPNKPDETSLVALCGNGGASIKVMDFKTGADRAALDAFREQYFTDTCGGSPIYAAWDQAISLLNAHPFRTPGEARAIVTITDGKNNRRPRRPDQLLEAAVASGINMFSIGPVRISSRGTVARGSVCRAVLIQVAARTDGAYFEPEPPPSLTTLPDPPVAENEDDENNPAALPDDEAGAYLSQALVKARQMAASASPALTGDLPPGVRLAVEQYTTLNVSPSTWEGFASAMDATANNPQMTNLGAVTYKQLELVDGALARLADDTQPPLSPAVIKDYYDTQIASMLKKIQTSLKRVYRVTYKVRNPRWDGGPDCFCVNWAGVRQCSCDRVGGAGSGGSLTVERPIIVEENGTNSPVVAIPDWATRQKAVTADTAPGGGTWTSELRVPCSIGLFSQTMPPGQPPGRKVQLAERAASGQIKHPEKDDNGPDQPLSPEERAECEQYLKALTVRASADAARVTFEVACGMPTCLPDPEDAVAQPLPNDSFGEKTRMIWYRVWPTLERDYRRTVAGKVVNETARAMAPNLVVYVRDKTPPNFALFLTTEGQGTSVVESRELLPEQSPPGRRYFLTGRSFGTPGELSARPLVKPGDQEPLELEGGDVATGYVVPQGATVRVQLVARDNFDRNFKPEYPVPDSVPFNAFALSMLSEDAARDWLPPYLPRLNPEQVGQRKEGAKSFNSGLSWAFEEGGSVVDAGQETRSFRAANVTVDGETVRPVPGQEAFIVVNSSDASGNGSRFRLPVRVMPVGIEVEKLFQNRQRR